MNKIDFNFRSNCAYRYHSTLAKNQSKTWLELFYELEQDSDTGLPEFLTLLHPNWYPELGISHASDPRGTNSFNAIFRNANCRSEKIWGYPCPYKELVIHVDHTFPYSRGGPTTSENAMYLCKEHNLSKNTDIHFIPWEMLNSQNWIKNQLKHLINFAQRLSKEIIYLPEKKLKQI